MTTISDEACSRTEGAFFLDPDYEKLPEILRLSGRRSEDAPKG